MPNPGIKLKSITLLAGLTLLLVLGALLFAVIADDHEDKLRAACLQANVSLTAIRKIQVDNRSLQASRADIKLLAKNWSESRTAFTAELNRLIEEVHSLGLGKVELSRLDDAWRRMENSHTQIQQTLDPILKSELAERMQSAGLTITYQRLLNSPQSSGPELADLGHLLLQLESFDRQVGELETELNALSRTLVEHAERFNLITRILSAIIFSLTLLGAIAAFWRLAHASRSLTQENTARRAAEEHARASEEHLHITVESIGDAVIATDLTGRITRINPVASRLTGWPPAEAIHRPLKDIFKIIDSLTRQPAASPVESVLATGRIVELANHTSLLSRDGTERHIADSAAPIRDANGEIRGVVLVFRDVTEKYQLENQIRQSQKIESIGLLAGGVAHDFNNILQIIKANLAFIKDPASTPEDNQTSLQQIDEAADRATDLTRQLLAFGRRQTLRIETHNPALTIPNSLKLIRRLIGSHIQVNLQLNADLHWIRADLSQLDQVLINLCLNARDAMPDGGILDLSVTNETLSQETAAKIPFGRSGPFVRIDIADTGTGMDAHTLAHLFEPFFTTKPTGQGTGLGLSVAQGILHQHEGFIQISSILGQGTTFSLFLPAAAPTSVAAVTPNTPAQASGAGQTILFAEDEPLVRTTTAAILQRNGYRVITATNGEEALELAEKHHAEISLALFDVVMPLLNGGDAARLLSASHPKIPILLCSGYAGGQGPGQKTLNPQWPLISKPYSHDTLLKAIHQALAQASKN